MMAWIALLLASLFSMLAQLCQKQSTRLMPSGDRRRHLLLWQGLALLMLGAGMALWLRVLQHIPVGIAYPMLSLNFIWITLAARFIWREPVTLRHWGGVVMIIAGVALLGGSR